MKLKESTASILRRMVKNEFQDQYGEPEDYSQDNELTHREAAPPQSKLESILSRLSPQSRLKLEAYINQRLATKMNESGHFLRPDIAQNPNAVPTPEMPRDPNLSPDDEQYSSGEKLELIRSILTHLKNNRPLTVVPMAEGHVVIRHTPQS